jgi:hypothetical protein
MRKPTSLFIIEVILQNSVGIVDKPTLELLRKFGMMGSYGCSIVLFQSAPSSRRYKIKPQQGSQSLIYAAGTISMHESVYRPC